MNKHIYVYGNYWATVKTQTDSKKLILTTKSIYSNADKS